MIEPNKLKPFTKFCYTIGMIPSSYKQSLTYEEQLIWFCDYLENTVIPAINNNAEALTEVQNLFTELQSYVDNYFENLDVQEEINNKLDEMVTDGTLSNLITPLINTEISELTNSINQLIDNDELLQKNISENFMNKIRYKYNNIINKINLPDNDFNNSSFFKKFPIFFNGTNHYYTNFDIKSMKNESEHIIYVDYQNGNNNNTGYEENLPKKTLTSAIGNASSGDTIILKKGWYPRQALELAIGKSINIIGEDGPDHDKVFKANVEIEGKVMGEGFGKTKKEAEQHAASKALERIMNG